MNMQMESVTISCLDTLVQEVRTAELTQQLKLPDGMPDLGKVLAAWGQVVIRGKEWREEELMASGGVLVWVLYQPEDGSEVCWLDSWIPFQMKWELPDNAPEGVMRLHCLTRFVDGRGVSPRKIMVRCGIAAGMEALAAIRREATVPAEENRDVELLKVTYPLRLNKEAGEKVFSLDEDISVADSAPDPEKLVYFHMEPRITDCRVLADKLAFRGSGNLHLLYRSAEGTLQSWDAALPFSQIVELDREYTSDAQGNVIPVITNLESEVDAEGHIRVKCGIAAQYQISDRERICIVEDAYSPEREIAVRRELLELPVVLETRRESKLVEVPGPMDAARFVDVAFHTDFPRYRRGDNGVDLEFTGSFQTLFYDAAGCLQSANARWENRQQMKAHEDSEISAMPLPGEPILPSGGQLRTELPVEYTTSAHQQISTVTAVEPGQRRIPDPDRPALILRRAGEGRLWDIAKSSGSTVAEIRRANSLQGEPLPGQLLLIPIP